MSLRTAIGGLYCILTIVCLLIVGATVLVATHRSAEALDKDRALTSVQALGGAFDAFVALRLTDARDLVAEGGDLRTIGRWLERDDSFALRRSERQLKAMIKGAADVRIVTNSEFVGPSIGSSRTVGVHWVGDVPLVSSSVAAYIHGWKVGNVCIDFDVRELCERLLRPSLQKHARCLLVDGEGRLLWDSKMGGEPRSPVDSESARRLTASSDTAPWVSATEAGWVARSPVSGLGWSCILVTSSPALARYRSALIPSLLVFLVLVVAVVCVVGFRLADHVARPLRTVMVAATDVAQGDMTVVLPSSRITEVDRLSATLNDMVATISSQRQELLRKYVQVESNNIMLERAYRDITAKTELLEQHQQELVARNEDVARKNQEIRDQNQKLGSLNIELARSNHQLSLVISELQRKDEALGRLRESEAAQAAAIIEGTGDLVIVTDNQGHLNLANPAALQFLGRSIDELKGVHCSRVMACRGLSGERLCESRETCPLARTRESSGDYYQEIVLIPPGRRPSDMGTRWSLVFDKVTGLPERAVCILRDMTRQKEVERAKSDFVSAVSHELRTPLTSMRGFTYLLLRDDVQVPTEEAREYLQMMDDEIGRLSRLIEGILNVSRIEAGLPVELKRSPVRLDTFLARMVSRLEAICAGRPVTVDVPEGLTVVADEDKLFQVLTNLVSNAAKFSTNGMGIHISASQEGDTVRTSVVDRGMGIAKEDLERVFERFYRGGEVRGKVGGSGLGLHIARALVEAHDGRIWAESEGTGKGSTFAFELPISSVVDAGSVERRVG